MSYHEFWDLKVWQKARPLKNLIWLTVQDFPPDEKYRLKDQLIRCSRSINSNIAEGHGRRTINDQIRFCIMAKGSLSECLNHLIDAYDYKFITRLKLNELKSLIDEISKMLNSYIPSLQKNHKPISIDNTLNDNPTTKG